VLTIVAIMTVAVSILLLAILRQVLLKVFTGIEREETVERIRQVENAFSGELDSLHALNGDWAEWNDTYEFVAGSNPSYVADNINPETFVGMGLDQMYIFDMSGRTVYSASYAVTDGVAAASSADLAEIFAAAGLIAYGPDFPPAAGYYSNGADLFLISSRVITSGASSREINGTMVMVRRIDQARTDILKRRTRLDFLVSAIAPAADGRSCPVARGEVAVDVVDRDSITGSVCLYGLDGEAQAVLRIVLPRAISALGRQSYVYAAGVIILVLIVLSATIVKTVNRRVTVRLERLVRELRTIRNEDAAGQVTVGGNDEIALLEEEMNATLAALSEEIDKARIAHRNERAQAEAALRSQAQLNEKVRELEGFQHLTIDRELKMIELKKRIAELESMNGHP
jgi:sensor domain CHASE-containing protein